ncbi:hypothetical protein QMM42_03345 [Leptospira santarosai]|nr:hypothetical protein [Leptospira santarosai]MDI7185254.1 hypothetical protein [Leptospira santarosai]MDI7191509.1 hypothetical protein [Leptospira santarosai]MDI7223045.1 hypothetical protein [Leptospira santarosai]
MFSEIEFEDSEFLKMEFAIPVFSEIEFTDSEFSKMEFSAGLEFAESETVKSEFVESTFLLSEK